MQAQEGLVRATQAGTASLSLNLTLPADAGTQQLVPVGSPAKPGLGSTLAAGSSLSSTTRIFRQVLSYGQSALTHAFVSHSLADWGILQYPWLSNWAKYAKCGATFKGPTRHVCTVYRSEISTR